MRTNTNGMIRLGDLVAAAFDEATHHSSEPKEVSRLATLAVMHMLRMTAAPLPSPDASHKANDKANSRKKQAVAGGA